MFLNTAIGELLEHFERQEVEKLIKIVNLDSRWEKSLELTFSRSEKYYKDSDCRQKIDEILAERSEYPEFW